jgi:hypothetical protein
MCSIWYILHLVEYRGEIDCNPHCKECYFYSGVIIHIGLVVKKIILFVWLINIIDIHVHHFIDLCNIFYTMSLLLSAFVDIILTIVLKVWINNKYEIIDDSQIV